MSTRSTRSLAGLLALSLVVLLVCPAAAQAPSPGLRPLSSLLTADGTLEAPAGFSGSLDARGYVMTTSETGAPRFVPEALARGAGTDGSWDDRFGVPGIAFSQVHALLFHDGDLYAAGWFTEAGGLPLTNVARWDGRRWHPLGAGVEGVAYALAWYNGELYVGGRIDKAGEVLAGGIARWDGTAWNTVGDGFVGPYGDPTIQALVVFKGALYAGGEFVEAGGVPAAGIARWDGTAWSGLGDVTRGDYGEKGKVNALAADATTLYAGGSFDAVDGVAATALAAWDGTRWSALGGEGLDDDLVPEVKALALQGDQLYVGGGFARAGGRTVRNVAVWNRGTQAWAGLGQGMRGEFGEGEVRALLPVGGDLFAAGDFAFAGSAAASHVARWNGTAWSALTPEGEKGVNFAAAALAAAPDGSVFVAGEFEQAGGLVVNRIARWQGGRFYTLGEGVHFDSTYPSTVYAVAVADGGKVYVGGSFSFAGSTAAENVAMWDGQAWHPLGSGTDGYVYTLAVRGDDVFAGGRFTTAGGVAASHVARWNAAAGTWHALGAGMNGDVWDLAVDGPWVYAVGDYTSAGGVPAEDLARWDGTAWSKLGTGLSFNASGVVYTILPDGDQVWVGGDFYAVRVPGGEVKVNSLLMWKPSTDEWFTVGGGVTIKATSDVWGRVYALAKLNGELYAAGYFDKAGTVGANGVARFDGTNWAALGSSVGGEHTQEVWALAVHGTDLYVAGQFLTAGAVASRAVARWNATTQSWSGLAGGLGGTDYARGYALARAGQDLYVGGTFVTAGGVPANAFAQWKITGTPPAEQATIRLSPGRLDFTELIAGRYAEQLVTITNVGSTEALSGTVGALGAPFSVERGGGAFRLAPGQSHAVTIRFAPAAAGDFSATLDVTHNGVNQPSPAAVVLTGKGASPNQTVTMRSFDPQSEQYYVRVNGDHETYGFVFGTNAYVDRSKAMGFTLPTGTTQGALAQVQAWFVYKKAGLGDRTYTLHVYDGTMIGGPAGQPLYSKTYRMADIAADDVLSTPSGPTTYTFDQPVRVGQTFFVVFDFGAYTATEAATVSLASTPEVGRRVTEVWEQWADGQWANLSDAWKGTQGGPGTGRDGWFPWIEATVSTGTATADEPEADFPAGYALQANYPNPFNPQTTIGFELPAAGHVELVVYDGLGREVRRLVDAPLGAGVHEVTFEAADLPSGLYLYQLRAGTFTQTRPMVLVK